eukprot:g35446.t1
MTVLGADIVQQLEYARVCGGIPSAHTPAWTEFHIGSRILYLPWEPVPHNLSRIQDFIIVSFKICETAGPLHFSPMLLIFGHPVWRRVGRSKDFRVGRLLGLAKLVINRFRQWAMEGVIIADCLPLFRGYVRAWVSLEKGHTVCTGALDAFWESEQRRVTDSKLPGHTQCTLYKQIKGDMVMGYQPLCSYFCGEGRKQDMYEEHLFATVILEL